ncbi:MAG: glycosyl hydrolase [Arthrobacter sp.]
MGSNNSQRKIDPEARGVIVLAAVAALVAAGIGGGGIYTELSKRAGEQERAAAPTASPATACDLLDRSELVPTSGALFGVNLDWHKKDLAAYATDLGHKPAVTVSFTGFPYTDQEKTDLQRAVEQIRTSGQIMLLTLEPDDGLASVTPQSASDLATDLSKFNADGVPVIVRFAHEMNGSWYPWSQQPELYIKSFRTIAEAVHTGAPGSATMWAPNYGGGYPFAGGQYEAKPGSPEFTLLDTDADGTLTMNDDPYAPYYPGDDAVDWVGMSLYHWGSKYPWGDNELAEQGKFAGQLTGSYVGANGNDSALPDFYQTYGETHKKPVAIPETAALFAPGAGGESELAIKQSWWSQLFAPATAARFPRLKMINWFEWDKNEAEVKGRVDWTVTNTPAVREAFTSAVPDWLHYGPSQPCEPGN